MENFEKKSPPAEKPIDTEPTIKEQNPIQEPAEKEPTTLEHCMELVEKLESTGWFSPGTSQKNELYRELEKLVPTLGEDFQKIYEHKLIEAAEGKLGEKSDERPTERALLEALEEFVKNHSQSH